MDDRFWSKVDKTETCWLWVAALHSAGYGVYNIDSKLYYAHRIAYEKFVGPIPKGLQIDHLCRVRNCVNPSHLEAVTGKENTIRAKALKLSCPQGHLLTDDNLVRSKQKLGHRACRTCKNAGMRKLRKEKRDHDSRGVL